jgi:hypothetical protein
MPTGDPNNERDKSQTPWRGLQRADDIAIMVRGVREACTLPS